MEVGKNVYLQGFKGALEKAQIVASKGVSFVDSKGMINKNY